jgi:hypothetical protein
MAGRGRGRGRGGTTLTRSAAELLKRNSQQEVETLQSQLWLIDEICRSTLPRATQVTLVQPQVGAINAQIANITNMLGDINAHAAAQSSVFTQDMVDEWNNFETDATALTNITFLRPAFNMWKARLVTQMIRRLP